MYYKSIIKGLIVKIKNEIRAYKYNLEVYLLRSFCRIGGTL